MNKLLFWGNPMSEPTCKLKVFFCDASQRKPVVPQDDDMRELYE
jgi:hypothetical protein